MIQLIIAFIGFGWALVCKLYGHSQVFVMYLTEFNLRHRYLWVPETLPETIVSGLLFITDLFQNKSVAYFWLIIFFHNFFHISLSSSLCNFSVRMLKSFLKKCPWKHKKADLKSSILMAVWLFISLCSPNCPKHPRTEYPFYRFFHSIVSSSVSDE